MSSVLVEIVNFAVRWRVTRRARVEVGQGSRVRWWALHAMVGGRLRIGQGSIVNCKITFDNHDGVVVVGNGCYIGASELVCHTGITLGDNVIISWGVTIVDHDSHVLAWEGRRHDVADWLQGRKNWEGITIRPVRIEDKVWIGFGASILKGVTIGEGAVVAAKAVVTRDVPAFTVVAGNPARTIRTLQPQQPDPAT